MKRLFIVLALLATTQTATAGEFFGVTVLGLPLGVCAGGCSRYKTYVSPPSSRALDRAERRVRDIRIAELNRIRRAEANERRYQRLREATRRTAYGMPDYMYYRQLEWEARGY